MSQTELDALRAENERLRMALEEIALPCAAEAVGRPVPNAVRIARLALRSTPDDDFDRPPPEIGGATERIPSGWVPGEVTGVDYG